MNLLQNLYERIRYHHLVYEVREGSREVATGFLLSVLRKINRKKDSALAYTLKDIARDYDPDDDGSDYVQ